MITNESLLTQRQLYPINNDFERTLCRFQNENQAILSRVACEISTSFTFIDSQLQLIKAHNPQLQGTQHWDQLSLDAKDISQFLHDFSIYIHSEQLNYDEINLAEMFSNIVNSFTEQSSVKDITLALIIGEPSLLCLTNYLCDSKKLRQALNNVMNWLIDISNNNGSIHINLPSGEDDFYLHSNGTKYMNIQFLANFSESIPNIQESVYLPVSENKCINTNLTMSIAHRIINAHRGGICLDSSGNLITLNIFLPV